MERDAARSVVQVRIREGTRPDFGCVLQLWATSGAAPSVTDDLASLEGLMRHDSGALLVAELGADVVGVLIAAWNGWRGSFFRLAVDPSQRRRGIATCLVREGERRLRARGALRLDALVAPDDAAATGLWRALGFELQPDRARFVRNL